MHIPDGFLSVPVAGALAAAAAGTVGAAVRRVTAEDRQAGAEGSRAPLMGVCAAFLFAAQMFNFPITGGTTGHLLGAALVTALLGPWRGVLVVTAVMVVQAFLCADGGVVALGANVFNMGVAGCLLTGLIYPAVVQATGGRGRLVGLALAAWASVVVGAGLCAAELALSGTVPARLVIPAMLSVHALIGLGEALLTIGAYQVLAGARPDLAASGERVWALEVGGVEPWRIALILGLGLLVVRLACPQPDGLDSVAEHFGFAARGHGFTHALWPDYALPGHQATGFDWLGSYLSAVVGMGLCAAVMITLGGGRRRPRAEAL